MKVKVKAKAKVKAEAPVEAPIVDFEQLLKALQSLSPEIRDRLVATENVAKAERMEKRSAEILKEKESFKVEAKSLTLGLLNKLPLVHSASEEWSIRVHADGTVSVTELTAGKTGGSTVRQGVHHAHTADTVYLRRDNKPVATTVVTSEYPIKGTLLEGPVLASQAAWALGASTKENGSKDKNGNGTTYPRLLNMKGIEVFSFGTLQSKGDGSQKTGWTVYEKQTWASLSEEQRKENALPETGTPRKPGK